LPFRRSALTSFPFAPGKVTSIRLCRGLFALTRVFIFLFLHFTISASTAAQSGATATTGAPVTLYAGPGRDSAIIGDLPSGTLVNVEGRSDTAHWMLVHRPDGAMRGWAASGSMRLGDGVMLRDLSVLGEVLDGGMPQPTATPARSDPALLAMMERLRATPVLYNMTTERLREIFAHGQALGNRADVFTKVGDSNTTSGDFLFPIGLRRNFCEPGPYSYLQETIDFYSQARPRAGQSNSFTNVSLAADNGYSSASVLDPFWAIAPCQSSESPLSCEYRLARPSIAVIMLGLMDVRYATTAGAYGDNMERVVQQSIEQGVIPVLTNNIVLPDQETLSFDLSIQNNIELLDIAEAYQTPLINLWAAVQTMPDYGIGPDRTHLKAAVGSFCSFNGPEQELGGTLRNLLTLQALDEIRRFVVAG
jgi:hypothetical protein